MRVILMAAAAVGIVVSAGSVGFTQAKPSATPSIEGVWRTTSVVTTGANAASNMNPPANLVIYTRRHYSLMVLNNPRSRPAPAPPKDAAKLTDAEKLARYDDWQPTTANAGTYEIKGTTLIRRALVSKDSPAPGTTTYADAIRELRFEGNNTMVQITKSAPGQPVSETRRTYARVE